MLLPTESTYVLLQLSVDQAVGVLVISLIGPAQVLGRVCMVMLDGRFSMVQLFGLVCLSQIFAAVLLMIVAAGSSSMLLFPAMVCQGAAAGIFSITRPIVTKELLGTQSFGTISGLIATTSQTAVALSPTVGAWLWSMGGYESLRLALVVLVCIGFIAFNLARRSVQPVYVQVDVEADDEANKTKPLNKP